jgi:hypothetical protein
VLTPHSVYVDNNIYLDVADICCKQAIVAGIEAVFILLGNSDTALRQHPISWDKLHGLLAGSINFILGLVLDLCCLTFGMTLEFISVTVYLLRTTWGHHHHSFKVKEAEELTGKLHHIAFGISWLKYLLGNIYASLAMALHINNSCLIRTNKWFSDALHVIGFAPQSLDGNAQFTSTPA